MQQYTHRRIDTTSSEFRLLRIEKSLDETSPISITLRHAQLDEEEDQFNALSYAWGDESPTYEVVIHDGTTKGSFRVRQNLFDFLCTSRRMTGDLTEWIWIDQICIDQSDNQEKCHQVSQMGQLYSTAKATVSWPGRLQIEDDVQLADNDDRKESLPPTTEKDSMQLSKEVSAEYRSKLQDEDPLPVHRLANAPLYELICSPYWSRTWIIQEIALARVCHVVINDELWRFGKLLRVFIWTYRRMRHPAITGRLELLTDRLFWINRLVPSRKGVEWYWATEFTVRTECLLPFDRVYAVMGLLDERKRFQPDYEISEKELLRRILQSELTPPMDKDRINHYSIGRIITRWSKDLMFQPVQPTGWLHSWGTSPDDRDRKDIHNNLLVFEELEIKVPAEGWLDRLDCPIPGCPEHGQKLRWRLRLTRWLAVIQPRWAWPSAASPGHGQRRVISKHSRSS